MTKVIAEIGVNWRNLDEADKMIRESSEAGADIAKFQAYKQDGFAIGSHLYSIALTQKDIVYLYHRCNSHGIEFLCTPMYPEAVEMLNPYVKRWKIRYFDRRNEEILSVCKATEKEMLVSGKNMYCVPEYPPIRAPIDKIPEGFCGVSSHYPDSNVVEKWARQGLEYLEVHVKRDEYYPSWCPRDNYVSITMSELAELCRRLKT
jgi:hypothetical protein